MFAAWMWPDRYLTNSSFLDAEIHCPLANTNSHRTMLLSVFPRLLHDNLVWRIVMKFCRAVCSSCFYVFGSCLFSCCVSEVFFLLYFLFFFFFSFLLWERDPWRRWVMCYVCGEKSCLQAHSVFLSGGLSQEGAFVWKPFITSRAGSASCEWRGCQSKSRSFNRHLKWIGNGRPLG